MYNSELTKVKKSDTHTISVPSYTRSTISPPSKNKSLTINDPSTMENTQQTLEAKRNSVTIKAKTANRKDSVNNSMIHNKRSLLDHFTKIDKKKVIQDIYVKGNSELVSTTLALKSKNFPKLDQFQTKKQLKKRKVLNSKSRDGVIDLTHPNNRYADRPDRFATTNDSLPPLDRSSKNNSIIGSEYNESSKGSRKSSKKRG